MIAVGQRRRVSCVLLLLWIDDTLVHLRTDHLDMLSYQEITLLAPQVALIVDVL